MNKFAKIGISTAAAAATFAGGLGLAASASTTPAHHSARSAAAASCSVARRNFAFPRSATTYRAGAAGAVAIAPVNSGSIRVVTVRPAAGYTAYVDGGQGSSVDVYLNSHTRHVKFEAEINDAGGLTVTVTSCHR